MYGCIGQKINRGSVLEFFISLYTVVWKIFVRIYFVVKYFRLNNFRGLSIPTKILSRLPGLGTRRTFGMYIASYS